MRRVLVLTAVAFALAASGTPAQTPPVVLGPLVEIPGSPIHQVGPATLALNGGITGLAPLPAVGPDRSIEFGRADCDGLRACSVVVAGVARTRSDRTIPLGR